MIDCIAVNQRTLLTCVLEGGCTAFFMLRLFRLRVKPVWLILYYAADIIFTYAVNTRFSNGLINFFMSLLAIFGYTLIFRTTLSQKIFAYTSLIIIMCFSEMIAASFAVENGLYRVSGTTSYRVVANSHYQYGLMLIISILCITSAYIMIYLLSIWVRKRDIVRDEKGFKIQDVCICIVSVLSFIILWVILVQYAEGGISTGVTIFMVVAMILIVMTFYISYEQMIKADR
jgi:hypothetical protein